MLLLKIKSHQPSQKSCYQVQLNGPSKSIICTECLSHMWQATAVLFEGLVGAQAERAVFILPEPISYMRKRRMFNKNKQAFTLIELLVVVLIIAILAAVALPQYQKAVEKAHLAEALTIGNSLEKAMKLWVLEYVFPAEPAKEEESSETIYFLGQGADATLDIELSSLSQDPDCDTCVKSNYFSYSASCNAWQCGWSAWRADHYQINSAQAKGGTLVKNGSVYSSLGEQLQPMLESYGFEIW